MTSHLTPVRYVEREELLRMFAEPRDSGAWRRFTPTPAELERYLEAVRSRSLHPALRATIRTVLHGVPLERFRRPAPRLRRFVR